MLSMVPVTVLFRLVSVCGFLALVNILYGSFNVMYDTDNSSKKSYATISRINRHEELNSDGDYSQTDSDIDYDTHNTADGLSPYIGYGPNNYVSLLQKKMNENIPVEILQNQPSIITSMKNINGSCEIMKYPHYNTLQFNNIYWQYIKAQSGNVIYLYSAYYDNRTLLNNNPVVRIIAMMDRGVFRPKPGVYCQHWYNFNNNYLFTDASFLVLAPMLYHGSTLHAYLITCQVPPEIKYEIPTSISLVKEKCNSVKNILRVVNNVPELGEKKDFAVCIKGLDFPYSDISRFMVEWLELLFAMDVDKVYFYKFYVHPNISKVLDHYESLGLVHTTPLTLPGRVPNIPGLQHMFLKREPNQLLHEKVPFHDCFYKNMNKYKFIAILDFDEIIIPKKERTWKELIEKVTRKKMKKGEILNSFTVKRVILLDEMREPYGYNNDIPKFMYMSQNIYRSSHLERNPKTIFNTLNTFIFSTHTPRKCIGGGCRIRPILSKTACTFHFRESCKRNRLDSKSCDLNMTMKDDRVLKYKDRLVERTTKTLKFLKLL